MIKSMIKIKLANNNCTHNNKIHIQPVKLILLILLLFTINAGLLVNWGICASSDRPGPDISSAVSARLSELSENRQALIDQQGIICPECRHLGNNLYSLCSACISRLDNVALGERIEATIIDVPPGMTQKELDKLNDYSKNMYLVRKNEILLKRADARDIPSICLDLLDLYKKLEWFSKEEHLLKQMTGPKWGETLFKENRQALLKRLFQTLVFKAGFNFYNNDFNGADQALKEAQNLGFTDWEAQYLWARTALEQGGYKRALDICSNIESNLKNKTGELASVYNKSRYLTKKIKGYIKYTRNAYDFYEKGYLAYSGKDYKGAVILFEKALNENPDFRQARVWLKRAVKKAR